MATGILNQLAEASGVAEFDLDAVDRALDRGDLEQVRILLGLSQPAWRLLLGNL
jgi:hypothetical protein